MPRVPSRSRSAGSSGAKKSAGRKSSHPSYAVMIQHGLTLMKVTIIIINLGVLVHWEFIPPAQLFPICPQLKVCTSVFISFCLWPSYFVVAPIIMRKKQFNLLEHSFSMSLFITSETVLFTGRQWGAEGASALHGRSLTNQFADKIIRPESRCH